MGDVFETVLGQPRVREFLRSCTASGRVSHAYLFCGPAGSNKTAAAYAFAQSIVCPDKGCGECDHCKKAQRRMHPDIHFHAPAGAQGYLVEQIREIVADSSLAPIQTSRKVYILDRADLMGVSAANAFLKTLEEPPESVVIILLGRTRESVLPTIVSRCQVVAFRHIPASEAAAILVQHTGATSQQAAAAIQACGGSVTKAARFLKSNERLAFRRNAITALEQLADADDLDVLTVAARLVTDANAPLDDVRREQEAVMADNADFLQKGALKTLAAQHKRMLSQMSFEHLGQLLNIVRAWLRDVMMTASGAGDLIINSDVEEGIRKAASRTDEARVCRALERVEVAEDAISYNVSPQLSIEAMLFEIREVLYGTRSRG